MITLMSLLRELRCFLLRFFSEKPSLKCGKINMLHPFTFGSSPAALYLAKVLNEIDNPSLNRNVTRSIVKVSTQINELVAAYTAGKLSSRTVANSLRLMRLDVPSKVAIPDGSKEALVVKLSCNVMISYIKRAGRMCEVAARSKRVMANPEERGIFFEGSMLAKTAIGYYNKDSGNMVIAGYIETDGSTTIAPVDLHSCQLVYDYMLANRSKKRLARLNKYNSYL